MKAEKEIKQYDEIEFDINGDKFKKCKFKNANFKDLFDTIEKGLYDVLKFYRYNHEIPDMSVYEPPIYLEMKVRRLFIIKPVKYKFMGICIERDRPDIEEYYILDDRGVQDRGGYRLFLHFCEKVKSVRIIDNRSLFKYEEKTKCVE